MNTATKKKKVDPAKAAQITAMRARGFLTVGEASLLCNVPKATLYNWLKLGQLSTKRVGLRKVYVERDEALRMAGISPASVAAVTS